MIGVTAAVLLLALGPSGALASEQNGRDVKRLENARVARFSDGVLTFRLRNGSTLRVNRDRTRMHGARAHADRVRRRSKL